MIDKDYYVTEITYNDLDDRELQARLIFSVIVAGKNAKFAKNVIDKLFSKYKKLPFDVISHWIKENKLEQKLREARSGNYGKLVKCLPQLIKVNPRTVTLEELEQIKGIGPKTSRFYHLWIGKNTRCAALDVHILKFLRMLGHNAPKNTPTGKKYKELEEIFLNECEVRGTTPNQLDADVWLAYSTKNQEKINNLIKL